MLLHREWSAAPIDWKATSQSAGISREDVAVLLARGTPQRFHTLQRNVFRLPPGYAIDDAADGVPTPVRQWCALHAGTGYLGWSLEELAAKLRHLLTDSVQSHSSGKRVGLLLSGGYDSTLLATLMARDGVDLRCYSVEAPDLFASEWSHALQTAIQLQVPIRKITVSLSDLLNAPAAMRRFKQSLNLCLTTAHLQAASRAAAGDGCDTVMLGTGSDELFGPCTLEEEAVYRFHRRAASVGDDAAWASLLGPSVESSDLLYRGNIAPFPISAVHELFPDLDIPLLVDSDVTDLYRELHAAFPQLPYESLTLQLELELRSPDVLMHELSAAARVHGMRVAFPFYDRNIVELAAGTPLHFKTHSAAHGDASIAMHKYLLRYAFRDCMPAHDTMPRSVATLPFDWQGRADTRRLISEAIEQSPVWEQLGVSRKALTAMLRGEASERNFWHVPRRFWLLHQLSQM